MTGLKGSICSGLGKGKGFIEEENYEKEFIKILGFKPFPGTLNLKVNEEKLQEFLLMKKMIIIKRFEKNGVEYGAVNCFKAKIKELNDYPVLIVLPAKTIHKGIIELVAEHNLREKFELKDKQEIILA